MSIFDSVLAVIEGVKGVFDVSTAAKDAVSDSVSTGIAQGFMMIRKPLEKSLLRISILFTGALLLLWGLALFIDNFAPFRGIGFVAIGAIVFVFAVYFLKDSESGQ